MELLVVCTFAYWLMKHGPEMVVEAAQEIGYGLRGQESPAAKARRERLQNAGYDPASGGAFGQYTGNLWRDFWTDRDKNRQRRRAGHENGGTDDRSWWQRQRDNLDEYATRQADNWRRRQDGADNAPASDPDQTEPGEPGEPKPTGGPKGRNDDDGFDEFFKERDEADQRRADPDPEPSTTEHPEPDPAHGRTDPDPDDPDPYIWSATPPHDEPHPHSQADREPIRVNATVGEPAAEPATTRTATAVLELEEGDIMAATVATRGIPVTGIQTGALECLSISRYLESAIADFQAQLDAIAGRVHSMGEQTLGNVQFSGHSQVVTRMAQAAEAVAATKAQAAALGAEVSPLLMQTRTEFLRRS